MFNVISKVTKTSTNNFSNCVFLNEQDEAYQTLEEAEVEMDFENEEEAWTDVAVDNSGKSPIFYAVYGTGSVMSNSHAEYVEIDSTEELLKSLTAFSRR